MAICIVCKQKITPKTGIQCQGSCSAWVHYGCLDYVTDDGCKMVHEPYSNSHMFGDVCVVNQLNDNDRKNKTNNNYDSVSDQYVNMNETASQVTQETVTKSVCQGSSIYKSLSLGMCSWEDTAFYGYSPRPFEYIPCGNVPHILLPTPYPIEYFPTANKYGENTNKLDAVNARHDFDRTNPYDRQQRKIFSPTSTATETDDHFDTLDSYKRNFPAISFKKRQSKSNISNFEYLHASQLPYKSYRSMIPLYNFNSPTLRHASTEVSDLEYFNRYNYSDYLNLKQRKLHIYESKSISAVEATETYENVYERELASTINLERLTDSFDKTLINSADLAALNAIKYNVDGMHKLMSSLKQNKQKETDTIIKNKSAAMGPLQGSVLPDILEKQVAAVTTKIKVSIKRSKSAPLSASLQATPRSDHLRKKKNLAVVTDKMIENVPLEAECQTSNTKSFSDVINYGVISTNTSLENSIALRLTKSVGSYNSKFSPHVVLKISETAKKEADINNSLANMDAQSSFYAKRKEAINKKCENLSGGPSMTNLDASIRPDEKREKSLHKISENLSASRIYSWTKLDSSKPDTISKDQINNIFGKILQNPEETDDSSSENVLTSCMKNVLSTFEMLSSQICDIFSSRKEEPVANYCSTVRSEGVISIVRKNNTTSNGFEKKHKCLTVKLLTFRNV